MLTDGTSNRYYEKKVENQFNKEDELRKTKLMQEFKQDLQEQEEADRLYKDSEGRSVYNSNGFDLRTGKLHPKMR